MKSYAHLSAHAHQVIILANLIYICIDQAIFGNATNNKANFAANGSYSIQHCPKYDYYYSPIVRQKYVDIFKKIEEKNDCAGACKKEPKYIFSNINEYELTTKYNSYSIVEFPRPVAKSQSKIWL